VVLAGDLIRGPCLQATSLADDALSSRGRVEASAEGCG
jgi:hypothetical protein